MAQGHRARSSDGNIGRYHGPERHAVFPRELPEQWKDVDYRVLGLVKRGLISANNDSSMSDRQRAVIPLNGDQGRGVEQSAPGAFLSIERILNDIIGHVSEASRNAIQTLDYLRECLGELIEKKEESDEFFALQRRTDLTSEMVLQAHRVQLETLVAVKTGIQGFSLVFLQFSCRSMAYKSFLPVDDCECKICSQKSGFYSACMCLVCSKFDFASDTCGWVGCDVAFACHISEMVSINGAPGTTETKFHCIGCEHVSEIFGLVQEVFKTRAKGWDVKTL